MYFSEELKFTEWLEKDTSQFMSWTKEKIENQNISDIEAAVDSLFNLFLVLIENKSKRQLQEILSITSELTECITYIPKKKAKLHSIKGKLELLSQIGEYTIPSIPDPEIMWILSEDLQIKILSYVYSVNIAYISRFEEDLNINKTEVLHHIKFLHENDLIETDTDEERHAYRITKKGSTLAKFFLEKQGLLHVPYLLKRTKNLLQNKKSSVDEFRIELKEYTSRYPETAILYHPLLNIGENSNYFKHNSIRVVAYEGYKRFEKNDKLPIEVGITWGNSREV